MIVLSFVKQGRLRTIVAGDEMEVVTFVAPTLLTCFAWGKWAEQACHGRDAGPAATNVGG